MNSQRQFWLSILAACVGCVVSMLLRDRHHLGDAWGNIVATSLGAAIGVAIVHFVKTFVKRRLTARTAGQV